MIAALVPKNRYQSYTDFFYAVVVAEDELVISKIDVAAPLEHLQAWRDTYIYCWAITTKSGPQLRNSEKELDVVEVLYRHLNFLSMGTFIERFCAVWLTAWLN
ncbi:MAG: hypothetical protein CM15mP90_4840 [Actinomycetota bacterium]|nr:MAG: hypothetical protein CM15mP90_4840 [Actinomycetota bacterium]